MIELDDYQVCPKCGHTGLLHGGSRGCQAVSVLSGYFAKRCGCTVKRNLRI